MHLPYRTRLIIAALLLISPLPVQAAGFYYTFNSSGVLKEAGSMSESTSPYFWVNSGGALTIGKGIGGTLAGSLPDADPLRLLYQQMNPTDSENGYQPQNTFRLITKSLWADASAEVSFRIRAQNLSDSPNRQGHNGILLMSRYQDQHNLYYAGIRNDGLAVIKKKVAGTYHTLASVQIFGVTGKYDRDKRPSLLPEDRWVRIKSEATNQSDGSVRIRLLLDRENDGSFISILSATDTGIGGAPLRKKGYAGVRTDFMDVEFDNLRIESL